MLPAPVEVLSSQLKQDRCNELVINTANTFTKRTVIVMFHRFSSHFPPNTDLSTGTAWVSQREKL